MAATRTLVSLEEYLHTSYEDGDFEFVDGEVISKPMPPYSHGRMQIRLGVLFHELSKKGLPFEAAAEVRSRTAPSRVRLPDVSIYVEPPDEEVPSTPPYIAVEILSPDDRAAYLIEKLREYRAWGVAHIWVIDPLAKTLSEFGSDGLRDVGAYRLPEYNLTVTYAEIFGGAEDPMQK